LQYFHGSAYLVAPGTVLRGRGEAYEAEWGNTDFYSVLETHRPKHMISHRDAVFMCADEDIDNCGGSLDVIYELKPIGEVTRHDMNWSSEISCLLSEGAQLTDPRVAKAAQAYWAGAAHHDAQVWEYLARAAEVLCIVEDNRDPEPDETLSSTLSIL
jgi:hypothetical protein